MLAGYRWGINCSLAVLGESVLGEAGERVQLVVNDLLVCRWQDLSCSALTNQKHVGMMLEQCAR